MYGISTYMNGRNLCQIFVGKSSSPMEHIRDYDYMARSRTVGTVFWAPMVRIVGLSATREVTVF